MKIDAMKKTELRALLEAAAAKQQHRAIHLEGSDNPQTLACKAEATTTYKTLRAVIDALDAPRPAAAYDLKALTI